MKKRGVILFFAVALSTVFSTVTFGQLFVEEAFKKAALPPDSKGSWVVRADVNLYKPDGTLVLEGSGYLDLKANALDGTLALRPPKGFFIPGSKMYL